MSLNMNHVYAFAGGAFVGGFTGIVPSLIITGLMLYMVDDTIFSYDNLNRFKEILIKVVTK